MKLMILFITVVFSLHSFAQTSVLEKKISLHFTGQKMETALKLIEKPAGVRFAYNSDMFGDSLYNADYDNESLQIILESLLGKTYAYRVKGNYIIIKSTRAIEEKNEKFTYTISGYIRDRVTGEIVPFASVYDSATLNGTLSNAQGFYELSLEQKPGELKNIGISKSNYIDTFILISPSNNRNLEIGLVPQSVVTTTAPVDTGKINLDKDAILKALTSIKMRWQASNFKKNFTRDWQVSFVPFLGTNGMMSGAVTNKLSLNILGGYAGGFRGAEFGGIFNIDRDTSSGAQFAGVYNLTAGPLHGAQFSGVLNNHFSELYGGQFAGVLNTCSGNIQGIQGAGVINFARRNIRGTQFAGVLNYAESVQGGQFSGVINTASQVNGVQVAGVVNSAKKVKGLQIGLINVADTVNGLQIGFLSFCKSGIHQVEYAYTDAIMHNLTLRTGSKRFYNIITAGYNPYNQEAFAAGYGVGTKIQLARISALHLEAVGSALYLGLWEDIHSLFRISIHHELTLFKTVSIIAGPDLNFYYSNGLGSPLPGYKSSPTYMKPVYNFQFNQGRTGQAWVGFHVGIGLN